jgi:hypothetical protein
LDTLLGVLTIHLSSSQEFLARHVSVSSRVSFCLVEFFIHAEVSLLADTRLGVCSSTPRVSFSQLIMTSDARKSLNLMTSYLSTSPLITCAFGVIAKEPSSLPCQEAFPNKFHRFKSHSGLLIHTELIFSQDVKKT